MADEYQTDGETYAEKDGSGNLVIKNIDEATIEKILDAAGTSVYDASTKTVGDGTTDANHSSVNTDDLTINNAVVAASSDTNQTIATDTLTSINLDSARIDDFSGLDSSNNKINITKNGLYRLDGAIVFNSIGDGTRIESRVTVNGSISFKSFTTSGAADNTTAAVTGIAELSDGDDVRLRVKHDSGADETIFSGYPNTRFNVHRIA